MYFPVYSRFLVIINIGLCAGGGLSAGALAGIALGAVFVLVLLAALLTIFLIRRRRADARKAAVDVEHSPQPSPIEKMSTGRPQPGDFRLWRDSVMNPH